jgi:hypothetical protein
MQHRWEVRHTRRFGACRDKNGQVEQYGLFTLRREEDEGLMTMHPGGVRSSGRIGYVPSSPAGPPPIPLSLIPPCFIVSP